MPQSSDIQPFSPGFSRLATTFRLLGWMGFWVKLVIVVVSSGIALFAVFFSRNPGTPYGWGSHCQPDHGLWLIFSGLWDHHAWG